MTILELCEPLFQYVCMLNRIARNAGGDSMEYHTLRPVIDSIFEGMGDAGRADPVLGQQYARMRLPLVFFVDSILSESALALAPTWNKNRIAYEQEELAGDEKFFDLLDQTLEETGPEVDERLAVYYTMLGLGFTGWYAGQSEYLRAKMNVLAARIKRQVQPDARARLCPEAYEHLDTRNLVQPPGIKLAVVAIVFAGVLLGTLLLNGYLFHAASRGLDRSLTEILRHDRSER